MTARRTYRCEGCNRIREARQSGPLPSKCPKCSGRRRYQCKGCGKQKYAPSKAGLLPERCDECAEPKVAASRKRRRALRREHGALLAQVEQLKADLTASRYKRVSLTKRLRGAESQRAAAQQVSREALAESANLKARLRALGGQEQAPVPAAPLPRGNAHAYDAPRFDAVETRARRLGPPGIDAVKRGLRLLHFAEGAKATAERALDLAAALEVWAWVLTSSNQGRGEYGAADPASVARRGRREKAAA